jgi:hypothetical protein
MGRLARRGGGGLATAAAAGGLAAVHAPGRSRPRSPAGGRQPPRRAPGLRGTMPGSPSPPRPAPGPGCGAGLTGSSRGARDSAPAFSCDPAHSSRSPRWTRTRRPTPTPLSRGGSSSWRRTPGAAPPPSRARVGGASSVESLCEQKHLLFIRMRTAAPAPLARTASSGRLLRRCLRFWLLVPHRRRPQYLPLNL